MTSIEIHFRLVTIRERLQQIQGELIVIADDIGSEVAMRMLGTCERRLAEASDGLQAVATANSPEEVLRTSISNLEERRRCAAIGAQVLYFPGTNNNAG